MTNITNISICVVTRNRASDLRNLFESLKNQSVPIKKTIIVSSTENNFIKHEKKIISNFEKNSKLEIQYIREKRRGFPYAYNTAINASSNDWVVFIDDDCIADVNWHKEILKKIKQYPKVSAMLGASRTYYSNNVFSLSRHFINELGKVQTIKNNKIIDLEILDAKNVVYNKSFLTKNRLSCDVGLVDLKENMLGASQDCDLGMQIQQAGGKALYVSRAVVIHKDPVGLTDYYKKLYSSIVHHLVYEKKWSNYRCENIKTKKVGFKLAYDYFLKYKKDYKLNFIVFLLLLADVFFSYLFVGVIRFLFNEKK